MLRITSKERPLPPTIRYAFRDEPEQVEAPDATIIKLTLRLNSLRDRQEVSVRSAAEIRKSLNLADRLRVSGDLPACAEALEDAAALIKKAEEFA